MRLNPAVKLSNNINTSKYDFTHQFGFFYKPLAKKFDVSSFKTAEIYFDQQQIFLLANYLNSIENNR